MSACPPSPSSASPTSARARWSTAWSAARGRDRAEPGVTRDRKRLACEWNGVAFELVDTGGIDLEDEAELARDVQRQARLGDRRGRRGAAGRRRPRRAAGRGRRAGEDAARRRACRSSSSSTKSTGPRTITVTAEFHELGLGEPLAVSATHGLGTGDLLDRDRRAARRAAAPAGEDDAVRVAVIGRPNVGKSSLVNAFLGSDRVIVSERAGTTRDAIDTELEVDGRRVDPGRHRRPAPPLQGRRHASTTTRSCAPNARSSAPTSRSSSATPPRASPPRTCASPSWR